jgi:hypothetical protein
LPPQHALVQQGTCHGAGHQVVPEQVHHVRKGVDEHRKPLPLAQGVQNRTNGLASHGIEPHGGLVQDQDAGMGEEGLADL